MYGHVCFCPVCMSLSTVNMTSDRNVTTNVQCVDVSWIGQQLRTVADALNDSYESGGLWQRIGRHLRLVAATIIRFSSLRLNGVLVFAKLVLRVSTL